MSTILEENVSVGSGPVLYFDFAYDTDTSSAPIKYRIKTTVHALGGSSSYGYRIEQKTSLNGVLKHTQDLKGTSPSQWAAFDRYTDWISTSDVGSVTLSITITGYGSSIRTKTLTYTLTAPPVASDISISDFNFEDNFAATLVKHIEGAVDDVSFTVGTANFKTVQNYISGTPIKLSSTELVMAYGGVPDNAKTATVTATVTTKNGSTVVGSNSATATGTIRGNYWKKINGTWQHVVKWKNVNGVWKRTVSNVKVNGTWQRGV